MPYTWREMFEAVAPSSEAQTPSAWGLKAWSSSPIDLVIDVTGSPYILEFLGTKAFVSKVPVLETMTFSKVHLIQTGAPASPHESKANAIAIYSSTGVKLAQTGSLAATWSGATCPVVGEHALTSPVTVTGGADCFVYVLLIYNVADAGTETALSVGKDVNVSSLFSGMTPSFYTESGGDVAAVPSSLSISAYTASTYGPWIGLS